MWIKETFLAIMGFASGLAVSAAVFAFAISIGIISRFAGKTHTTKQVLSYEDATFLGGIFGTLMSIFHLRVPGGIILLSVFGLSVGIFTGCLAVAVAEILNVFPILFRRTKMKVGQSGVMIAMALGKVAGALYFYANLMAK